MSTALRRLGELPAGLGAPPHHHGVPHGRFHGGRRVGFLPELVSWPSATTVDLGQLCAQIVATKGWDAQPEWCKTPSGDPGYARVAGMGTLVGIGPEFTTEGRARLARCGMGLTPVDQAVEGVGPDGVPRGDCLSACVATLLDLPTSAVPLFWGPNWGAQVASLNGWLARRGLSAVATNSPPAGAGIAKGRSPRFASVDHCVVWRDGGIIHDPHSTRAGLAGPPTAFLELVPVGSLLGRAGMGSVPGSLGWVPPAVKIDGIPNAISGPMPDRAMFKKIPIATGAEGTLQTLQVAGEMALEAASDPFFADEARSIVRCCTGRDYRCYSESIFNYLLGRDAAAGGSPRVTYREQPIAQDGRGAQLYNYLRSPSQTLFVDGGGLCLDMAVLAGALCAANGLGFFLRAVFLDPGKEESSHVYAVALSRDGSWALDIVPVPAVFGSEPPPSLWTRPPIDYVVARP